MATGVNTQTANVTPVATSTTAATLNAAGSAGRGRIIVNDSAGVLYVKFGGAATATDWTVKLVAGGYYELPQPLYGGIITGVLDTGTGTARVTSY